MGMTNELQQLHDNLAEIVGPAGLKPIAKIYRTPPIAPPTTEDLPCIILFCRQPPKIEIGTFGVEWRTTIYNCQFLYMPVGQGILDDTYWEILQYLEPIQDVLWAHSQNLNNVDGVQWSYPSQESMPGVVPEKWGGQAYFGIDFSITCSTERNVTINAPGA